MVGKVGLFLWVSRKRHGLPLLSGDTDCPRLDLWCGVGFECVNQQVAGIGYDYRNFVCIADGVCGADDDGY